MKYTITQACGHQIEQQLYGSGQERDRRERWLRAQPCLACQRRAGQDLARERQLAQGLPALSGTAKQVAWAGRIRAEKLDDLATAIARDEQLGLLAIAAGQATTGQVDTKLALWVTIRDELAAETAAHWWIEHRGTSATGLVRDTLARKEQEG